MSAPVSTPRVSIGVPVRNGENYIRFAIESILAQTFRDFEIIICDNASTDGTEEICREYASKDNRIRYFRNLTDIGAAANHNKTFELSSAEYFKWCSHDDVLAPRFLEKCVAALDNDPDALAAQAIVGCIDSQGTLVAVCDIERLKCTALSRPSDRFATFGKDPRPCYEVYGLIRRKELAKTELIAPYPWSDITLLVELSLIGRFAVIDDMLSFNRDHPDRFSRTALLNREASWLWWCGREVGKPNIFLFYRRCPNWYIQVSVVQMIKKHLSDPGERYRTYLKFLQHIVSPRMLCLLIAEPILVLYPGIFKTALKIKRKLERRGDTGLVRSLK